ncbi:MAG: polyprenol monophosphomannose synthase [Dermabacter sp.]|nr:polyprenol monophosphomannose synthase [Dermabacter sp.]
MTVLVVIPTYNEREALPRTLARLLAAQPEVHVLVVDDGSPDGTGAWVAEQARADERLHLLERTEKAGLGPAYLAGFAWALERDFEVVCEMDADASHRPEQLSRLLDAVERGADLAIGSRWIPGGAVHRWPKRRTLLSRGANMYARIALGIAVHDATAGYRAFRADALRSLMRHGDIASQGYCFQVDMTRRAAEAGLRIREVPIDFDEREQGYSKMSGGIVTEAMVKISMWGFQRRIAQLTALGRKGRS